MSTRIRPVRPRPRSEAIRRKLRELGVSTDNSADSFGSAMPVDDSSPGRKPKLASAERAGGRKSAAVPAATAKASDDYLRAQIRLSRELVSVLEALRAEGYSVGNFVERVLWKDVRIRDAASILGLETPEPRSKPAA